MATKSVRSEVVEEVTCDICGAKQDPRRDIYWACRISRCDWHVPADGVNHGTFSGDICRACREAIEAAICGAIAKLRGVPGVVIACGAIVNRCGPHHALGDCQQGGE